MGLPIMKAKLLLVLAVFTMLSGCIVVPPDHGYHGGGYHRHGDWYRR